MTSYTRALYRRDPAAAEAFHKAQSFEHRIVHGKTPTLACFTLAHRTEADAVAAPLRRREHFGLRSAPMASERACPTNCGHPGCTNGCTRNGGSR